jgi:hypothetical protein
MCNETVRHAGIKGLKGGELSPYLAGVLCKEKKDAVLCSIATSVIKRGSPFSNKLEKKVCLSFNLRTISEIF